MFESYAQNCEDVVLWRALRHVEAGTYVDVGAADPDEDSVTKAFYERGWSGVNIEPAPEYAERLRAERPRDTTVQVCAGAASGSATFHHVPGTGLSSVVDSSIESLVETAYEVVDVDVPVRRLDQILSDAGLDGRPIHFLKVDVEGFEESVLRGIDLSHWRPWVIVAEATAPRSPEPAFEQWEPILLSGGYEFCLFDGLNRFYLAHERAELAPALSYPASVFDQPFITPPHAMLLQEYNNLLEGNGRLEELREDALRSYSDAAAQLQGALDAYHRLEVEYENALEGYERLHREYDRTLENHIGLRQSYDDVLSSLDEIQQVSEAVSIERYQLRDELAGTHRQLDRANDERDAMRDQLELTTRTVSWRVTRPLRAIRRLRAVPRSGG